MNCKNENGILPSADCGIDALIINQIESDYRGWLTQITLTLRQCIVACVNFFPVRLVYCLKTERD